MASRAAEPIPILTGTVAADNPFRAADGAARRFDRPLHTLYNVVSSL